MSFYTSLTGLNAATTQLAVTSNNIANSGTGGFKRSDTDFGDIFATSPLEKASSVVGRGVSLKEVSQEFSQGNIEFSANSLDLAITGDGFFPLESSDGTKIYTRNGAFMLNEQNQMVNSAGQALQSLPVDSTNKADFGVAPSALTIPRATVSEFLPTTQVELGLNLPSEVTPITATFNPDKPDTYHKTTSLTVYGTSGSANLATIYYVKTANATADSPTNKWQTYVYIDDKPVDTALIQASDTAGDQYFINKYGELKTRSELLELQSTSADSEKYLITQGTLYKKYSYDVLSEPTQSVPASAKLMIGDDTTYADDLNLTNNSDGVDFTVFTREQLEGIFTLNIDDSTPVSIGLEHLAGTQIPLSGAEIAFELTNIINERFGDGKKFDLSAASSQSLTIRRGVDGAQTINLDIPTILAQYTSVAADVAGWDGVVAAEPLAFAINQALANSADFSDVSVSYDFANQGFRFIQNGSSTDPLYLNSGSPATGNNVFGLPAQKTYDAADPSTFGSQLLPLDRDEADTLLRGVLPNGTNICATRDQRFGMKVTYSEGAFTISSGTTGDTSSLAINLAAADGTLATDAKRTLATEMFGISELGNVVEPETSQIYNVPAVRGQVSTPAVVTGNPMGIDPRKSFSVNADNSSMTVIIDSISAQIELTEGLYSIGTFTEHLQEKINLMADSLGRSVSGITVSYQDATETLQITGSTTTDNSFIQVAGHADWGLENIAPGFGSASTFIELFPDTRGTSTVYVTQTKDGDWVETTDGGEFDSNDVPYWTPIFLDKGELTFDTSGSLVSPVAGVKLESAGITGGDITLNYDNSTQFNSPFSVLSQSQNGAPEGDLVGVNIGDDGLVVASYSNGSQKSLGKIILANFATPKGLRQVGDTSYYATSVSGEATYGEPGSAGFGTIRAGARERSNVDLTAELVDLITAQRNFQANAKAIETSSSLTQTIIQIRG
ncbi:MAG: flagellar hook-basal body complex protein [Alphaproteobacteria bacterium]|nr:flagellar hook-basal body complex protein [Alphaproteobacteria bacterium]